MIAIFIGVVCLFFGFFLGSFFMGLGVLSKQSQESTLEKGLCFELNWSPVGERFYDCTVGAVMLMGVGEDKIKKIFELEDISFANEVSHGFDYDLIVEEKHKEALESLSGCKIDLDKYLYYVTAMEDEICWEKQ